jgi:ATP-binding cassette subfamily F protein 3
MLQINNLSYSIGDQDILHNLSWTLGPGERAALIGDNGAGKTTLFRIIAGEITEYQGILQKPRDLRIGYLPQEEITPPQGTVLQTVLDGARDLLVIRAKLQDTYHRLENTGGKSQDKLLERAGRLESRFAAGEGYQLEVRARRILTGLGFRESDGARAIREFSGGWKMRAYLARLLLGDPDLLLLDEPTNHLDLTALEWLEQYLQGFTGSIVLVSHDRFFIDRLADRIVELQKGSLRAYPGNYAAYEQSREAQRKSRSKAIEKQRQRIQDLTDFVDRNRARKDRAAQAKSRMKELDRMEILQPEDTGQTLDFSIEVREKSFRQVVKIREMFFRYPGEEKWLFEALELDLFRGEKIALVGPNGIGKTTLVNLIAGELSPSRGRLTLGEKVQTAVFNQHQIDSLNLDRRVYDELAGAADHATHTRIMEILGIFHFTEEDARKKIGILSGGEKARIALIRLLFTRANFLVLDEPTSHLDPGSRVALETALRGYAGTLLLISHDRYFLDKVVTRVVELSSAGIESFPGNYSYYRDKKQNPSSPPEPRVTEEGGEAGSGPGTPSRKEIKQRQARIRQETSIRRQELNRKIAETEGDIHRLEEEQKKIERDLADPEIYTNRLRMVSISKRYSEVKKELELLWKRWEETQEQMEDLLKEIQRKQSQLLAGD